MNNSTNTTSHWLLLLIIAFSALALLGGAMYLQIVQKMLPCPLCVLQRYAFVCVAIFCFAGALSQGIVQRSFAFFGLLSTLTGAGIALRHLWIKANPTASCGIDPLETSLNTVFPAKAFPLLFQADGLCTTDYAPIFGLSIPQWSLFWFVVFLAGLIIVVKPRIKMLQP